MKVAIAADSNGQMSNDQRPGRIVESLRRVLHAVVIFVIAFAFLREFAVEPYGVPTGSMATSFLGNHRECPCPRCGFPVIVGEPARPEPRRLAQAACPNCGCKPVNVAAMPELPGDRLMVDKNVFNLRSPRRWEVSVFRCPVDDAKPYVKRVVGLPGEAIQLRGGDVFADGVLLRKSRREFRDLRVLVFDHSHAPTAGWGPRWLVEPLTQPRQPATEADSTVLRDGSIVLDATRPEAPALGLTYRHWNLDAAREEPITDELGYNAALTPRGAQLVHDFAAEFEITAHGGAGSVAMRLFDGLDSVFVQIPVGASDLAAAQLGRDGAGPVLNYDLRLEPGRTYRMEFAFVDRRAWLAVNGRLAGPPLDLSFDRLEHRSGASRPFQAGVRGVAVSLRNFRLYRDVYYRGDAANGTHNPWKLAPDQYFVLGDNSNSSNDSREWPTPGVPERSFIGKPFLIHQPLRLGQVNVGGEVRSYQTIDWSRLRWVR